jgi:AraC family transcriptional regulator
MRELLLSGSAALPVFVEQAGERQASAILRVIEVMYQHLDEPLSLEEMSAVASLSPHYFNHLFSRLIGLPPGEFFAALRFSAAKRLLLTTASSITDICFNLGYASLGSFTARFTKLVGLSPRLLRQRAARLSQCWPEVLVRWYAMTQPGLQHGNITLQGTLVAPAGFRGLAFVGLFSRPIPQGWPVCCGMFPASGSYVLGDIPDGCYYVMAVALSLEHRVVPNCWLESNMLVGRSARAVSVVGGRVRETLDICLHSPTAGDPPLLLGIPFVLEDFREAGRAHEGRARPARTSRATSQEARPSKECR